ncbi:MAG: septal ring lytic transglycosylase RlpA family protein [Spirochaetaceae bacterium]|nr:septal ring lytic transglycosylase RlpA family protein [Spirochaetaceae bacterium]
MKRIIALFITGLALAVFCAAQTDSSNYGIFRQEGIASWYGQEFAGRPTASGEIFNPSQFTAAHPTLPFGTLLKVTNRHNNRSVTVRVNDRGPFVSSRIIDVSRAAAEQLDIVATGTAPVLVESLTQIALPSPAPGTVPLPNPDTEPLPASPEIPVYDRGLDGSAFVTLDDPPQNRPADRNIPEPQVYPNSAFPPVVASPSNSPAYQGAPAADGTPQVSRQLAEPAYTAPAAPIYYPLETAPSSASTAQNTPAPSMQDGSAFISSPRAEQIPLPPAIIKPAIPPAGDGKSYRIQVGSFKVPRNAADAFERLRQAGLNPAYERAGEFYRVVISQVRSDDVQMIAGKLGTAGFREALIRAEN